MASLTIKFNFIFIKLVGGGHTYTIFENKSSYLRSKVHVFFVLSNKLIFLLF